MLECDFSEHWDDDTRIALAAIVNDYRRLRAELAAEKEKRERIEGIAKKLHSADMPMAKMMANGAYEAYIEEA